MLLTHHAKERIIKRLAKSRKLEHVYSSLRDFLKNAEKIEINEKVVIFSDKRKSLVCVKLEGELLGLEEIKMRVSKINESYECIFWGKENFAKITTPRKFLKNVLDGSYYCYINKKKKVLYLGKNQPLLVITLRPAKKSERSGAGAGI